MPTAIVAGRRIGPYQSTFPDATNTGYRNAPGYPGSLTDGTGTTATSNTTYNFMRFPGGLDVGGVGNNLVNVTFNGCRFDGAGDDLVKVYGDNFTFSYCSFEPGVASPPVSYVNGYQFGIEGAGGFSTAVQQLTVDHCDFWGFANAIDTTGSTQAKPHVFRDNWFHDTRADGGGIDHTDGIGSESASSASDSYVVIDHNSLVCVGNTNGIAYQANGNYDHFLITNNLIGGWGYAVNVSAGTGTISNIGFSGNTFTTLLQPQFGPLYNSAGFTGYSAPYQWRNNIWRVPTGAAWGNPAHDGLYWMPVVSTSTDDATFTSATDYTG